MNEPFSAKDWMQLTLRIATDGTTDLSEVLLTLRRAARADLAWIVMGGEVIARFGVAESPDIDELLVAKAMNVDKRFEFDSGGSCEIARRELTNSGGYLVAGREDDFTIEDHQAISTIAHLLDLGMAGPPEPPSPVVDPPAGYASPTVLNQVFGGSDLLTGLLSRDAFRDRIEEDVRDTIGAASLIMFDLDGFTIANDTLGFGTGDIALQAVASRIQTGIRDHDIAARVGGDEFAVYCPGIGIDLAAEVAQRLQSAIASVISVGEADLTITAAAGVASAESNPRPDELMGNADTAMRAAKLRGAGSLATYDEQLAATVQYRRDLASELQEAIIDNQLTTVLEPIVSMPGLEIVGHEALVRWQHPARGLLEPAHFLDLAESIGRIGDIERAVISFALQHQLTIRDEPATSINLSSTSFLDPRQLDWLFEQMETMHIRGSELILELREEVVLADPDRARAHLELLQSRGIGTALDRFGSGPTSIATLHSFPFNGVKLDPALLKGPSPLGLLKAIYASADLCGFDVIHPRLGSSADLDRVSGLEAELGHGTFYCQGRAVQALMGVPAAV